MARFDDLTDEQRLALPDWLHRKRKIGFTHAEIHKAKRLHILATHDPIRLAKRGAEDWNLWAAYYLLTYELTSLNTVNFCPHRRKLETTGSGEAFGQFEGIVIPEASTFMNMAFVSDVSFQDSVFCGGVFFSGTTFQKDAIYTTARFFTFSDFSHTNFIARANFGHSVFLGRTSFDEAKFFGDAYFHNTSFTNEAMFDRCWFLAKTTFEYSSFLGWTRYTNTVFASSVRFNSTDIEGEVSFNKTKFIEQLPLFSSTTFRFPPDLNEVSVPSPENLSRDDLLGDYTPSNAALYRRLKEFAAEAHDHHMEGKFFRYELLAKRGSEVTSRWGRWGITLYELTAKCGQSFWRPFLWWFGTLVFFWIVYSAYAWSIGYFPLGRLEGTLLFALNNHLPFIGLSRAAQTTLAETLFGGNLGQLYTLTFVAIFQNLLATVFIFLAGLGARNFFKLR